MAQVSHTPRERCRIVRVVTSDLQELRGLSGFHSMLYPDHTVVVEQTFELSLGDRVGWVRFAAPQVPGRTPRVFWELLAEADLHWTDLRSGPARVSTSGAALARLEARDIRATALRAEYAEMISAGTLSDVVLDLVNRAASGEWIGQLHANGFHGPALHPSELVVLLRIDAVEIEAAVSELLRDAKVEFGPGTRLVLPGQTVSLEVEIDLTRDTSLDQNIAVGF
jgi:hypothetical protein